MDCTTWVLPCDRSNTSVIYTLTIALKQASSLRAEWLRDLHVKIPPSALMEFESYHNRDNRHRMHQARYNTNAICETLDSNTQGLQECQNQDDWELL